jgi:hypothetical protein
VQEFDSDSSYQNILALYLAIFGTRGSSCHWQRLQNFTVSDSEETPAAASQWFSDIIAVSWCPVAFLSLCSVLFSQLSEPWIFLGDMPCVARTT